MTVWVEELACLCLVACENEHHRVCTSLSFLQRTAMGHNTAAIEARISSARLRLYSNGSLSVLKSIKSARATLRESDDSSVIKCAPEIYDVSWARHR